MEQKIEGDQIKIPTETNCTGQEFPEAFPYEFEDDELRISDKMLITF